MRERLSDYQEKYGDLYNLEATPAESTSYRLAKHDKVHFPDIITAHELSLIHILCAVVRIQPKNSRSFFCYLLYIRKAYPGTCRLCLCRHTVAELQTCLLYTSHPWY